MFISDVVNSAGQNVQLCCDVAVWWKLRNCFKLLLLQEWGGERGDCQAALAISALRVTWKNKNLKIKSERSMRYRVIGSRRNRDYCWWELLSELKVLCFWNSPVSSLPRCVLCGRGLEINGVGEDVGGRVETRGEPGISDLHCCSDTKLISSNTW